MIPDKEVPASINAKEVELITLSGDRGYLSPQRLRRGSDSWIATETHTLLCRVSSMDLVAEEKGESLGVFVHSCGLLSARGLRSPPFSLSLRQRKAFICESQSLAPAEALSHSDQKILRHREACGRPCYTAWYSSKVFFCEELL